MRALDGVDLEVAQGTVMGLLGPNGAGKTTAVRVMATLLTPDAGEVCVAGKTTAVRVMATLLTPDAGEVCVAGLDVVRDAVKVRHRIGLAGQYAASTRT